MTLMTKVPITPAQIRAGRALVNWNQQQLAVAAEVSLSSVRDYENERRGGVVGGLSAIRKALENEGVTFLAGDAQNGPGVRLTGEIPNVLRRPSKLGEHDALHVPIEWRGATYELFMHREALEDLEELIDEPADHVYADLFDRHRAAILAAGMRKIKTSEVGRDRRVHIEPGDI